MGSSSSRRSGRLSSSRQSATRRRSPPDSVSTEASPGGHRSASIAISTLRSRFQASAAAIRSSSSACSAPIFSKSASGSPQAAITSSYRSRMSRTGRHTVHDVAHDVLGLVEVGFLLQQTDAEAGRQASLARVPVVDARHDPQQRRLAGAVRAEHTDLGPGIEGQRDVLQHLSVGRMEASDLAHREDELGCHGRRSYRSPFAPLFVGVDASARTGPRREATRLDGRVALQSSRCLNACELVTSAWREPCASLALSSSLAPCALQVPSSSLAPCASLVPSAWRGPCASQVPSSSLAPCALQVPSSSQAPCAWRVPCALPAPSSSPATSSSPAPSVWPELSWLVPKLPPRRAVVSTRFLSVAIHSRAECSTCALPRSSCEMHARACRARCFGRRARRVAPPARAHRASPRVDLRGRARGRCRVARCRSASRRIASDHRPTTALACCAEVGRPSP